MSTRFVIAAPDSVDPMKWLGIYGHSDGYPTGSGKELYAQVVTHFKGDLTAATAYYINAHPAGWRYLGEGVGGNECYCHDMGEGTANTAFETERGAGGMDWTYVLRPGGLEIRKWGQLVTTVPWDQERTDWAEIERGAPAAM